jgi:hypothetical protein
MSKLDRILAREDVLRCGIDEASHGCESTGNKSLPVSPLNAKILGQIALEGEKAGGGE